MTKGDNVIDICGAQIELPTADNTSEALKVYRAANIHFRSRPWPQPYDRTTHRITRGDARDLSHIPNNSIHLVVTSPPYWTLKPYNRIAGQLAEIDDYETFLDELDTVWRQCERILVPGGRICCVVGDVCIPRRRYGRHFVMPLHADIQVRSRAINLDTLTPIIWHKIANGVTEATGNGAGYYGKPFQPGSVIKNDIEYILFMRKGGQYRKVTPLQKALSILTKDEMQTWWRSIWTDIRGASTRTGHPAPYPPTLAERLIRMFSFAGDTVFDPFLGTGSTTVAAIAAGRNSDGIEIDAEYLDLAKVNIESAIRRQREVGAVHALLTSSAELRKSA